jgi:hypothetical protein
MEAARVVFAELDHVVKKPWSSADATSLRGELRTFASRKPIEPEALKKLVNRDLIARIRAESPLGSEAAEAVMRLRRAFVVAIVVAFIWPITLYSVNSDFVVNLLTKFFKNYSGFIGNIAAGLVTTLIAWIVSLLYRRTADRQANVEKGNP